MHVGPITSFGTIDFRSRRGLLWPATNPTPCRTVESWPRRDSLVKEGLTASVATGEILPNCSLVPNGDPTSIQLPIKTHTLCARPLIATSKLARDRFLQAPWCRDCMGWEGVWEGGSRPQLCLPVSTTVRQADAEDGNGRIRLARIRGNTPYLREDPVRSTLYLEETRLGTSTRIALSYIFPSAFAAPWAL